jgi:hypothetical protein
MRSIRILSVALVCIAAACSKSDKSADAKADSAAALANAPATGAPGAPGAVFAANSCVEGTWKKQDGTFTQTITFNPDKTGEEVHSRDDKRTFAWTVKNDTTVEIAYTTAGSAKSDWNVTVDCKNNRLTNGFAK